MWVQVEPQEKGLKFVPRTDMPLARYWLQAELKGAGGTCQE